MSTIVTATEFVNALRSLSASDMSMLTTLVKDYPSLLAVLEENFTAKREALQNIDKESFGKIAQKETELIMGVLNTSA